MSWKNDVIMKIEALNESAEKNKFDLDEHVDKLEGGEKSRREERNILLQRTLKRMYDYLNNVDKKIMATIKTDAYDTTRQLDKVQRELKNLLTSVYKADESQEGAMKGLLHKLQADNFNIDVDAVTSMCNVSVGCNVLELEVALVRAVSSGIYLKNDAFDLKMLEVKVADSQTKHRLGLSGEEYAYYIISSPVGFPHGVLKHMSVNAVANGESSRDGIISVLNSTVAQMKENNKIVADGINAIVLKIKRPSRLPEANVWLTVSLFKTVLRGCPSLDIVRSGLNSADLADMTATAKEQLNGTIFCDLDDENLGSQDNFADQGFTTGTPSAMPATAIQSNGSWPAPPSAKASVTVPSQGLTNGNSEKSGMPATPFQSNCFRPSRPSGTATSLGRVCHRVQSNSVVTNGIHASRDTAMPPTAMQSGWQPSEAINLAKYDGWRPAEADAPNLAKYPSITVSKVNTNNNSPSIRSFKAGGADACAKKVPDLSDVREVTGEAEATMPFSPKPDKGMVSTMRPTTMAGKLNGARSKVQGAVGEREVAEQNNEVDSVIGASKNVLPNVEDIQKSLSSTECSREDDSMHLEGPEVEEIALHNRSVSFATKTNIVQDSTTPQVGSLQPRFTIEEGNTKVTDGQAGGVKRLAKERDDGNVNDTEVDSDDPHLYLNASKAPSPTLANQTLPCDPAWNVGTGAVHVWAQSPVKADQSFATKVGMSDKSKMELSVWDIPDEEGHFSTRDIKGFNLALGLVDQIATSGPGVIGGGKFCMQSPVHIEYVPSFAKFLISEPEYNRIGVYSKGTLQFQGWFGGRNEPYKYPTSILYLDNGYLVVVERSKINIYDKDAKLFQKIGGRYNGLAKDPHGNFISTNQIDEHTTLILVFGQKNGEGDYVVKDSFPIDVKDESKVRFLAVHAGKIYASDYSLSSIYVVDIETKNLTTWDLKFNLPCAKPCGMLLDDRGNVLVADSGNNRLIVLNGEGDLFREISVKEKESSTPSDIVKSLRFTKWQKIKRKLLRNLLPRQLRKWLLKMRRILDPNKKLSLKKSTKKALSLKNLLKL